MQKSDRIFVDGLNTVKVSDGVVHLEFCNNVGTTQEPVPEPCGEIVMTRQAFLAAFATMEEVVGKMVKAGIIKRRTEPQAASGNAENSPNFQ